MKNNESKLFLKKEVEPMTIDSLLQKEILRFAKEPKANPQNLDFNQYTVSLIEHDYPAKTPVMWNAVYQKLEMPARNIMLVGDPKNGSEIFDVLRRDSRYIGGGAGVGFKGEALKYIDQIDPLAEATGAINLVVKTSEGKLKGYNTDGIGYVESLKDKISDAKKRLSQFNVLVLGAGGTANAIVFALAKEGASIIILNRTVYRAESLAKRVNEFFGQEKTKYGGRILISKKASGADIIISTIDTPQIPIEKYSTLAEITFPDSKENIKSNLTESKRILNSLKPGTIMSDIVIRKEQTQTLAQAQKTGFSVLDGIGMVINQGVEAFFLVHPDMKDKITKEEVRKIMQEAVVE